MYTILQGAASGVVQQIPQVQAAQFTPHYPQVFIPQQQQHDYHPIPSQAPFAQLPQMAQPLQQMPQMAQPVKQMPMAYMPPAIQPQQLVSQPTDPKMVQPAAAEMVSHVPSKNESGANFF
jgi:hypothetical protein